MKSIILLVLVCGLIIMPSSAFCHGWANHEQGAKAHGMGGAFTGLADDPSAVYYNPAGITQVEGTQISLGFTIPTVRGNFKSAGTSSIPGTNQGDETEVKEQYFFVPNFYFTKQISDQLSFGVGGYSIFGLGGFEWPASFEGRFASGGINGELQTMTLSPVVAYEVSDNLSIAFGGRIERADLDLQANIFVAPGMDEITSKISGYDYGMGWNAALFYHIHKELSIGLSYRSDMKHSFDDVDVEFSQQFNPAGLLNTKSDLDITLPQFVSLGLAWSKGPFTFTADTFWYNWSKIDNLTFKLDTPVAGQSAISTPMKWNDTWSWAVGGEYVLSALDREISLRTGIMYEECPIPDDTVGPIGFQGDNILYNLGIGAPVGPLYSDFFVTYIYTKDRHWDNVAGSASNPGGGRVTGDFQNYETYIIGGSLTYKF